MHLSVVQKELEVAFREAQHLIQLDSAVPLKVVVRFRGEIITLAPPRAVASDWHRGVNQHGLQEGSSWDNFL